MYSNSPEQYGPDSLIPYMCAMIFRALGWGDLAQKSDKTDDLIVSPPSAQNKFAHCKAAAFQMPTQLRRPYSSLIPRQ